MQITLRAVPTERQLATPSAMTMEVVPVEDDAVLRPMLAWYTAY